jgi:hypothetical protein
MSTTSTNMSMFDIVKQNVASKSDVPLSRIRDQPGQQPYSNLVCLGCNRKQSVMQDTVFSTCSKCHAVKYCSRDCQLKDWKGKGEGPTKPRKHKDICQDLKTAIEEFQNHPTASGVMLRTQIFPDWADQCNTNGSFHLHEFLARKRLLGNHTKGFWAIPNVLTPYHTAGKDCDGYQNGQMLLQSELPSMQEGWVLEDENERVDVTRPPPSSDNDITIVNGWKDYIEWRNLLPTSVAPLLMTNTLTLYQMIRNELRLYDPSDNNNQEEELLIYVLAVEAELNQIPLLQELLHLMPGIRLELIYLSPAAKSLCDEAVKNNNQNSLLTAGEHVLDVQENGGRLRVKIDREYGLYEDVPNTIQPDAVVGLNAGLAAYKSWAPAMHKILRMGTPFCFSDQTKLIQQFAARHWIPSVVETINKAFPNYRQLTVPTDMTIELNPFHGIVGRDVAYILAPNICNGYLLTHCPE